MKYWSNKKIYFLIFFLIVLCSVILISYKNSDNQTILEDKEEIKVNRKHFGMYVENEDGEFVEYTDSELFPDSSMYTFNEEKSYCVDNKDNVLENVISYSNGKVTVTSNKTVYCTLYFDRDNVAPIISVVIIDNYYTSAKLILSSNEDGIYCVNTSNTKGDISNCVLEGNILENSSSYTNLFSESNTYYVHIKDTAGNETISDALDVKVLYQKVEYIEATGTQYIETDYYPTSSTMGRLKFNVSNESGWMLYGYYNSEADTFRIFNYENNAYLDYGSGGGNNRIFGGVLSLNTINNIEFGNRYVKNLDTDTNIISNTSVSFDKKTTKAWIFDGKTNGKIYYVQIYENNELINNFVSVYRLSDGVVGMFEEINKNFYSSKVDQFIKGNDIDIGVPIVSAEVIDNNTLKPKILMTSNKSGVYCINNSKIRIDMSNCIETGNIIENTSIISNVLLSSGEYYVHIEDAAGNIGVSIGVNINISNSFGMYLKNTKTLGFNSNIEGGLYRYQGKMGAVNNYVCFGISDKDECLKDTDSYMYRIIGVNESNQVKLIKNEALNETMQWYSNQTAYISWPQSTIYSNINGSSFLKNSVYIPEGWEEKIDTFVWKYGKNPEINLTANDLYKIENAWTNTIEAKIGLIYAYDYFYAYQSGGLNCSVSGNYSSCILSWMFTLNCDSNAPSEYEFTMSYSEWTGIYWARAYTLYKDGYVYAPSVTIQSTIRPVFYLTTSVNYVSGSGTSTDPFIIL